MEMKDVCLAKTDDGEDLNLIESDLGMNDLQSQLHRQQVNDLMFSYLLTLQLLQCFDAVGWVAGRASGL